MSAFDFLLSNKKRQLKELKKALVSKDVLEILDEGNVDQAQLQELMAQKNIDPNIHDKAKWVAILSHAKEQLEQGNTEPAQNVYLTNDRSGGKFFRHLTGGTPTIDKMRAKMAIAKETQNPPGDFSDPSFVHNVNFSAEQQRDAINGLAALGLQDECQKAMSDYIDMSHAKKAQSFVHRHVKSDDPVLKQAAIRTAIQRDMLQFDDHIDLIRSAPDDAQRIYFIKQATSKMAHELARTQRWDNEKDHIVINTLLDHIEHDNAENGMMSPSQAFATDMLGTNQYLLELRDRISSLQAHEVDDLYALHGKENLHKMDLRDHLPATAADRYFDIIIHKARQGDDRVLDTTFKDTNNIYGFIYGLDEHRHATRQSNYRHLNQMVDDILPPNIHGEEISKARVHFATKLTESVTGRYHAPVENLPNHDQNADIIAHLVTGVITDPSITPDHPVQRNAVHLLNILEKAEENAQNTRRNSSLYKNNFYKAEKQDNKYFQTGRITREFLEASNHIAPVKSDTAPAQQQNIPHLTM